MPFGGRRSDGKEAEEGYKGTFSRVAGSGSGRGRGTETGERPPNPNIQLPAIGGEAHVSTSDFAAEFPALNKQLTRTLVLPRRYDTMLK